MTHTILVIARARTGSTVLRQCLGSSKSAFDLGEVFHAATYRETNFWRFWHELSQSDIRLAHPHYLPEIWQKFLAHQRRMTGAETLIVDAKVEYLPIIRTPHAGHYWPIFPVTGASDETKIIRLYRKNVLAQVISLHLAKRNNIWFVPNPNAPSEGIEKFNKRRGMDKVLGMEFPKCSENSPLKFDPEQLVLEIEHLISEDHKVDMEIGNLVGYKVYYEDLFDDDGMISAALVEDMLKVINVRRGTLCRIPVSTKQNTTPIVDLIENVEEVYDALPRKNYQWMLSPGIK